MAPNNPSMRDLIRLVESAESKFNTYDPDPCVHCGSDEVTYNDLVTDASCAACGKWQSDQIEEDNSEKLLYPPIVYDGEGNEKPYEIYHTAMNTKRVGDTVASHAAAPGMGKTVHRITRMDDTGVYGIKIEDTVQIMEPWMVEDSDHGCAQCGRPADGNEELCSECAGGFYEAGGKGSTYSYQGDVTQKEYEGFDLEYDSMYGVYKLIVGDQVILLGTDDYEEAQREAEAMMQDPNFYESNKPYAGTGKEPYATMTDGPDKYLFRKDGKQKLVGSADNEPEDGEEELEETSENEKAHAAYRSKMYDVEDDEANKYDDFDTEVELEETMDKEIREMQIAAGIIVAEDEHRKGAGETECKYCNSKDCDYDCDESQAGGFDESVNEEAVEEGKLPDALKKHQFGAKDDDKEEAVDDKEEAVDEEVIEEDCPTDPDKNADGECSPLTHIELDEDDFEDEDSRDIEPFLNDEEYDMVVKAMSARGHTPHSLGSNRKGQIMAKDDLSPGAPEYTFDTEGNIISLEYRASYDPKTGQDRFEEDVFGEDLLLAPEGPKGPAVDEDDYDMIGGEDQLSARSDRDMSDYEPRGDDYAMDEGPDSDDSSAMECPRCKDIALVSKGITGDLEEFECESCGNYQTMPPMTEQGPGEFDYDPDVMVDVGDKEDYEVYDFDNEFETMLGGSSDPVGVGAGSMYEMNEIRRLAGLEPIKEKKAKKDYDGDGKVESEEDEYKGSKDKAIKKAMAEDKADKDYDGDGEIESSKDEWKGSRDKAIKKELDEDHGDVVAYDIADEKAYYVMADLLGAELDFGPEDEVLVPAERNDQIIAALTDQGFEMDRDYRVAGQMLDDLQNGYNDRAFTKGQDYFPKGAQSTPASDLGPSASGMADNPMSNKMRMVKKDEVYENMRLAYRRHRKNG